MLTISGELRAKIIAHARKDHPDEACGVIAGPIGSNRPERFIPMENAERSPTFYRFDSLEQLKVWREMDDRDEEAVVIYHSHTATEAYPSRTDVSYALDGNRVWGSLIPRLVPPGLAEYSVTFTGSSVTSPSAIRYERNSVSCSSRVDTRT